MLFFEGFKFRLARIIGMWPATVTRIAGLHRLKASSNGAARRSLTMLHPPKFENEKKVSSS